ncbi:MAG: hypothetical protein JO112_09680 [Planctomycetes bacterium]|nr:hypothetical protein [Planctomycetota bacterium]
MASRWAKVRVGILLVFIAACILGGAVFLEQIPSLLFMVGLTPSLDILRVFGDILQICAVLVLGQGILAIVGYCFCLVVPNKHAALGLAIAALALGGVNLILRLTFGGIHFGGEGNFALGAFSVFDVEGRNILPILRDLLFLAELLVFPLFLRAVALARKEEGIASMCLNVVIVAAVHAGVKLVYYLVIYSFANSASRGLYYVINTLYWITVLIFLGQIAFYAITLKQTRDAL